LQYVHELIQRAASAGRLPEAADQDRSMERAA
jgi:hypothetical protein